MAPVEDKDASTLPIDPAVWETCFPEFASALRLIGSRGRHDVYETTRLDTWSIGRVAIVGDAAHAMPPQLAQGACCAMMNALSLVVFVSDGSDVVGALQRWQAQERGLTDHTQARSAELARTRALGSGMQWDDIGLRAALHVPTGTRPEDYARLRRAERSDPDRSLDRFPSP
jgi:2-methyl-3-hydroxypyridine 5-carboxylic acid dioxygenase